MHQITPKFNMNRIKEVLEEQGKSQTWLSKEMRKSYNMVNSYVQNRRQPSIEILFQIAKILNVEAKELLCSINEIEQNK